MTTPDEIAATIESLPDVLAMLLEPIDSAVLTQRPAPAEWSVHEVIGHLVTCDGPAFRDRIRAIVDGEPDVPPFDAATAMEARDFNGEQLSDLLRELGDERSLSAAVLRALHPADLARTSTYGPDRRFAANDFVHEWPFHDHDHTQQILDILKFAHVPAMSDTMRRALELD